MANPACVARARSTQSRTQLTPAPTSAAIASAPSPAPAVAGSARGRHLQLLFVSRCCYRAAFAVLPTASPALLLRLVRGDAVRAQRIVSRIATVNSLTGYFLQPLLGQISDHLGTKPVLVALMIVACACRLRVALRPTIANYVAGRVIFGSICGAWMNAYAGALGDAADAEAAETIEFDSGTAAAPAHGPSASAEPLRENT